MRRSGELETSCNGRGKREWKADGNNAQIIHIPPARTPPRKENKNIPREVQEMIKPHGTIPKLITNCWKICGSKTFVEVPQITWIKKWVNYCKSLLVTMASKEKDLIRKQIRNTYLMWSINSDLSDLWQQGCKRKKLQQKQHEIRTKPGPKDYVWPARKESWFACRSPSMCGKSTSILFSPQTPDATCRMPWGEYGKFSHSSAARDFCDAGRSTKITHTPRRPRIPEAHSKKRRDMWGVELHNCISCCQMPLMFFALFFAPVFPALLLRRIVAYLLGMLPNMLAKKKGPRKDVAARATRREEIKQMKFKTNKNGPATKGIRLRDLKE